MADRKLVVQILGDSRQLERTFARTSRGASTWGKSLERAGRGGLVATVGFRGLGRSVAFASGAFLGGAGFVAGARAAIKASSDLAEEQNKTRVLFGQSADEIRRWSQTTATALGLSRRAAQQAAGNFGAMFATLKLGDRTSTVMSKRLVQLGADLASFSNEDPSDMLDRLRSGLSGEAEPLRRFGILLSEARVKQEAYRSGLAKTGADLTEQQKVLARFNLILADSTKAQGDFARTSQSQANQERINAALREEAMERVGRVLLPLYNQATRAVNKWLGEEKNLAQIQNLTQRAVKATTGAVRGFVDVAKQITPTLSGVVRLLGGTENAVKLLLAAMVAGKVVGFASSITGLGSASLVASGRVSALRFALLRLGAIGVITLGIELVLNRKDIEQWGADVHRRVEAFFGGGVEIPVEPKARLDALQDLRKRLLEITGPASDEVRSLDNAIEKLLRRIQNAQGTVRPDDRGGARGPGAIEAENREAERAAQNAANRIKAAEQLKSRAAEKRRATDAAVKATKTSTDKILAAEKREAARLEAQRRAQAQRQRRIGLQLEALGLTSDGQQRAPGVGALRGRLANLREQLKGTALDTDKTRSQLSQIARVLKGEFGAAGRDVRLAILDMFNQIASGLKEGQKQTETTTGNLTAHRITDPRKILGGLGLSPEEFSQLYSRMISQSSGGGFRTTPGQGAFGFSTFGAGQLSSSAGFGGGLGGAMIFTGPITVVSDDPEEMGRKLGKKGRRAIKSRGGRFAGNRGL